ncbi:MAG TPA: hypothetical protein VJV79_39370, partial [Polyangiaceae bacterium]|nr:hypothetical protein [Polyangiaceae bacterium]
WSGVGVTAVALGIGVGFALKGAAADNRAEEARGTYPPGTCPSLDSSSPCNEIDEALSDRESANKIANVSFIVAGVAAVATATMFFVWPRRHNGTAGHVQIVPIATRDTGGLMVNASF